MNYNCSVDARAERKTKDYVWQQVIIVAGRQKLLLSAVEGRKLSRFAQYVATIRCRRSYYKEQWMVGVADEDRVNQGMNRPVDVVIAAHRGWQKSMNLVIAVDRPTSVGVPPPQRRLGVTGISL